MIHFVVDSNRAGAAQLTGTFEVFTAGLVFRNLIYPQEDQNGDGLDDRWAEAHGLAGDDPDPDRDGVPNDAERIAGTDPNDPASAPILSIHAAGVQAQLTAAGFGQREYRLYRTDNLVTGHWSRVGPALKLSTNGPAVWQELIVGLSNGYYGFSVTHDPVSRLPGRPQVILVGGGETNHTLLNQESASAFTLGYQLTGGYAGVTLLYDDYGTEPREFADFSGYSELSFGISGTARSVKFEFEDAALNKASGAFQFVGGAEQFFTIDLGLIARDGVDLSRISFINFVVDLAADGSTNPGCVAWRTFGLNYTIEPPPQPTGPATVLREPAPQVIEVGGGNNATGHERFGTTNILVNYDVGAYGTWDGITILYDNYGTEPMESADYSDVESLTIGLAGLPAALKLEFDDTTAGTPAVPVYCRGLATGAVQYFTVRMRDLEAGGLDSGHVRFINVVVDQALAGAGNYTGTFTVATGGLAP
jgi:hypothetical protein